MVGGMRRAELEAGADEGAARGAPIRRVDPQEVIDISSDEDDEEQHPDNLDNDANDEEDDDDPNNDDPDEDDDADDEDEESVCHPGYLEMDFTSSQWDDWDENCHGEMDTNAHREECEPRGVCMELLWRAGRQK